MATGNFSLERVEAARQLQVNLVEQMGTPLEIQDHEAIGLLFNAYTKTMMRGHEATPIEHQLAHTALRARLRELEINHDGSTGNIRWIDAEPVVQQPLLEAELGEIQDFERKTRRVEGETD